MTLDCVLPSSCVPSEARYFAGTGGAAPDSRDEVESLCTGVPTVAGTWWPFALVPAQSSHIKNSDFLNNNLLLITTQKKDTE